MQTAKECRERADALKALALMFPEKASSYAEAERRWRHLERLALEVTKQPPPPPAPG